jgi:hypothetical protein
MFYLWFFFQLHNSALNYWPLSFMIDSLFFMWSYTKYELVKLTWFFLHSFFYLSSLYFCYFFFKSSFFILISNCGWRIGQINSSFFPSTLIFLKKNFCFILWYLIIGPWTLWFFCFLRVVIFILYHGCMLVKLTQIDSNYHHIT